MPIVSQSDDPNNSASSPGLEMDEFLPIVKFKNPSRYPEEYGELIQSDEEVTLSDYIDDDKRTYTILSLTTEEKKLRLPFTIKQGGSGSWDDDGFVEVKLSVTDGSVKLASPSIIESKYDTEIDVDIEIKATETTEFYIDFFANDDEEDYNSGELENVFCGRVKLKYIALNLKKVYHAISLMQETDYRSSNLKHYRDNVSVKNAAFTHLDLGSYLTKHNDDLAANSEEFDGEQIHFLSIFSHGYQNNIFGDSDDTIEKSEIAAIFSNDSIHFSEDAVIFLGACNAGTGLTSSFAQKLASITGAVVIGMVDDGVAVVEETTGTSSNPMMIYGPKYGDSYNGKFYEFRKGTVPILKGKTFDIIKLVDQQKLKE